MKFSTSTITSDNTIVPWLAADGPLAYSPFLPPIDDYFFLYNFMFPNIFSQNVNLREHHWFGDPAGQNSFDIRFLRSFWEDARYGCVQPIFNYEPTNDLINFEAPIAIFKHKLKYLRKSHYLFIQHGSYLEIPISEQPLIEDGFVQIYRGIGTTKEFNFYRMPEDKHLIDQYRSICMNYLSDSSKSFILAHANTFRCETGHLKSSIETFSIDHSDDVEISTNLRKLQIVTNQCYTLCKNIAKNKFGPAYVAFKTPITNIRICTFFAGESEVKVLSLDKLIPIKATRCKFKSDNIATGLTQ